MLGKIFNIFSRNKEQEQPQSEQQELSIRIQGAELVLGNAQHKGKRNYQEDSFGFSDISEQSVTDRGFLAVLADGMGGLKNGKAVSSSLVNGLIDWYNRRTEPVCTGPELTEAAKALNVSICDAFCRSGRVESGSTLVAASINYGYLHWLCIGDSRLYIKRGKRMYRVNEDHDYLNHLLDDVIEGRMELSEALTDPQKDSLACCIGDRDLAGFDYSKKAFKLQNGDLLILCSDGIYNALSEKDISDNIDENAMASCQRIISLVAARNIRGQDNNTISIMAYKELG